MTELKDREIVNLQKPASWRNKRMETGPVQFPDDWPGMFIRGDHSAHMAMMLDLGADAVEAQGDDQIMVAVMRGLAKDMRRCIV